MSVLPRISEPRDLRALTKDELLELCREIREFTVEAVQKTGGHISSSLGTVELTVALHRVFDSPRDKLVWDTGHQAYVHKILTGRRERFDSLRQFGGISGFLSRSESEHDVFGAGHAGTSISAAHGMAIARDLKGEDFHVVAVIGDGALTAGLAFEGLNNVGHDRRRVIVVLNDNGMSIAPNVGAVSRMLEAVRTAPPYREAKHVVRNVLDHMPGSDLVEEARRRIFNSMKALLIPNLLFEQFGFTYFGPIDGHDLFAVEHLLEKARDFRDGPIVAIYSTFLQRAYDQVLHDVAVQDLSIVLALDRAGIVGDDGRTHQGLYDIAYLRPMPGMTLMAPRDERMLRHMLWTAYRHASARRGSIAVRFPRGAGFGARTDEPLEEIPLGTSETLREGDDIVLLAYGHPVNATLAAAEALASDGIEATVIDARFAKPLDAERFLGLAARIPRFVTIEEHVVAGGFGSAVAELFSERGAAVETLHIGVPDEHVDHGAQNRWRHHYGLDAEGNTRTVRSRWPQLVRLRTAEGSAG